MPDYPAHPMNPLSDNALIRMENITKRFPGVVANQGVGLRVLPGAFHAVIGENGAGKSTLLNILYGRYRADAGRLFLRGEEITNALHSPADAIRRGIGLVSQHYALIPALTVLENVMLGAEPTFPGGVLNQKQAAARIAELADQLGLSQLDVNQRAERLSVAAGQKVEILKALYRGAQILLLDEPTATLAPQEAESLFSLLHRLVEGGATIVFVTHKLREVMTHSSAITVLRAGRNAGDFLTSQTDEQELLLRMIGSRTNFQVRVPLTEEEGEGPHAKAQRRKEENTGNSAEGISSSRPAGRSAEGSSDGYFSARPGEASVPGSSAAASTSLSPLLQVENVTVRNARRAEAVQNVSLEVGAGEIVGIAGVDGSGQRELSEAIVGLRRLEAGRLFLAGVEFTSSDAGARRRLGIAYIPEDRHRMGMVMEFSVAENYLLGHETDAAWGGGLMLDRETLFSRAATMIQHYDVRLGNAGPPAISRTLSGGNQQKVVVARALDSGPRLLVACQPTRGLDVEASRFVYKTLRQARERGLGVLLFSLDLDEIRELSDRVAVMFNGRIAGVLSRAEASPEAIGALMTGSLTSPEATLPTPEPSRFLEGQP